MGVIDSQRTTYSDSNRSTSVDESSALLTARQRRRRRSAVEADYEIKSLQGRDDTWPAGGVAAERGESYDLLDRGARQQLAWDRLRRMRDVPYIVSGPTPYYHTLIPAAGLGTPALDISSPSTTCKQLEGNETRFVGLEALVDDLYDGSCERAAPALQRGVDEHYNASLHRLLARSACDGTALPPKGLALKRRLVAAQRRAAAERHPSILDAMHRLGLVTAGTREQRDATWVEGRWVDDSV